MSHIPGVRIRVCNAGTVRGGRDFVLYSMIAFRRTQWIFALDRSVEWAQQLTKPLVIFEPLRISYPWASERLHKFIIDGMADNAARIAHLTRRGMKGVQYFPYIEPAPGIERGLLAELARHACIVVTDDYPISFIQGLIAAAATQLPVRLEAVDSNGLLPLRATERVFTTAFSFRMFLQQELPRHLEQAPKADALAQLKLPATKTISSRITHHWPPASDSVLLGATAELAKLPIDHSVRAVHCRGGAAAARRRLANFLDEHVAHYHDAAHEPDTDARSALSPYLHFGHISVHEIFHRVMAREGWSPNRLSPRATGKRKGWLGGQSRRRGMARRVDHLARDRL